MHRFHFLAQHQSDTVHLKYLYLLYIDEWFSLYFIFQQITGISFSSVDPDYAYIQGVDYEVIAQNKNPKPCIISLKQGDTLVTKKTMGSSLT